MLTYQVRPRVFRIDKGKTLKFPGTGEVKFHFQPLQPFGGQPGGGRTVVRAIAASAMFNANNGKYFIESQTPLNPIDVTIEEPKRMIRFSGNVLTITQTFDRNEDLTELVEGVYFALPMVLAVDFADPPYIERVDGAISDVHFRWELKKWKMRFWPTTQDDQEKSVISAWQRLTDFSAPRNRRLVAAFHYHYVALRLTAEASIAGEFLPEAILNYSKVLEVLFPPSGDGKTRDAARKGLTELGFSETEIEADYMPVMALRNEIDVAHVDLALFTPDQLTLLHKYTEHIEQCFKNLLKRILDGIKDGTFNLEPYRFTSAGPQAVKIFERLRQHESRYEPRQEN